MAAIIFSRCCSEDGYSDRGSGRTSPMVKLPNCIGLAFLVSGRPAPTAGYGAAGAGWVVSGQSVPAEGRAQWSSPVPAGEVGGGAQRLLGVVEQRGECLEDVRDLGPDLQPHWHIGGSRPGR